MHFANLFNYNERVSSYDCTVTKQQATHPRMFIVRNTNRTVAGQDRALTQPRSSRHRAAGAPDHPAVSFFPRAVNSATAEPVTSGICAMLIFRNNNEYKTIARHLIPFQPAAVSRRIQKVVIVICEHENIQLLLKSFILALQVDNNGIKKLDLKRNKSK
jgi:hypothetical protein